MYSSVDPDFFFSDSPMTPDYAWAHREGRNTRYDSKRVGGTVCVHFIKKNMWFLETAVAFLEMQDTTELEMHPSGPNEENERLSLASSTQDSKTSSSHSGSPSGHPDDPDPITLDVGTTLVDADTEEPDTPTLPTKDMRVVLVQPGADGLPVRGEGGRSRSGDSVFLPVDEAKWLDGTLSDDHKRAIDSDAPEEGNNQATMVSPPAGHFANGSRRVNIR